MKQLTEDVPQMFNVELTREEVEYICRVTKHPYKERDENGKVRLGLFVNTARLLGFTVNDDGSVINPSK
jgi:hypothetical protein